MKQETFQKGMALLSEAFPRREFNAKLYFRILQGLTDQEFEAGVLEIVTNVIELYPDTNLMALIKQKGKELAQEKITEKTRLLEKETEVQRLDRWRKEAAPMPEESREILQKFGIKNA